MSIAKNEFKSVCERSIKVEAVIKFYEKYNLDPTVITRAVFLSVCEKGHLETSKWIHTIIPEKVNQWKQTAFKWACEYNKLDVAMWLYSLGHIDANADNGNIFFWACYRGYLDLAQWLHTIGAQSVFCDTCPFEAACVQGHLEMAKWLHSLEHITMHHKDLINIFKKTCLKQKTDVAKWLHAKYQIEPKYLQGVFKNMCSRNKVESAKWIYAIEKNNIDISKIKYGNYPSAIRQWIATIVQ